MIVAFNGQPAMYIVYTCTWFFHLKLILPKSKGLGLFRTILFRRTSMYSWARQDFVIQKPQPMQPICLCQYSKKMSHCSSTHILMVYRPSDVFDFCWFGWTIGLFGEAALTLELWKFRSATYKGPSFECRNPVINSTKISVNLYKITNDKSIDQIF
jgi:hypothetical protein